MNCFQFSHRFPFCSFQLFSWITDVVFVGQHALMEDTGN
jgi:hypothetical protein